MAYRLWLLRRVGGVLCGRKLLGAVQQARLLLVLLLRGKLPILSRLQLRRRRHVVHLPLPTTHPLRASHFQIKQTPEEQASRLPPLTSSVVSFQTPSMLLEVQPRFMTVHGP